MTTELKYFTSHANDAVNIIFLETAKDMENPKIYKPKMTYQMFEKELIFGYNSVTVNIYYSAHSLHCYVDIKYDEVWENDKLGLRADSIIQHLQPWLREAIVLDKEEFLLMIDNEKQNAIYGEVIREFQVEANDATLQFTTTKCDLTDPRFGRLHKRFESLLIMYIEAANFIDLFDSNWHIIYLYQKQTLENGQFSYFPIGFCTIYIFVYKKIARISQFFIIPKYQRMGLGKKLLTVVYEFLQNDTSGVRHITVESPNDIFTEMRDKIDAVRLSELPNFKEDVIHNGFTSDMASLAEVQFKMDKTQAYKIYEILRCHYAKPGTPEFKKFKSDFINDRKLQAAKNIGKVCVDDGEPSVVANIDPSFDNFRKRINKVLTYLDERDASNDG